MSWRDCKEQASRQPGEGIWLPGLPGPGPVNFLFAQKVTKKAPAPFGLDPRCCPIGLDKICRYGATESQNPPGI